MEVSNKKQTLLRRVAAGHFVNTRYAPLVRAFKAVGANVKQNSHGATIQIGRAGIFLQNPHAYKSATKKMPEGCAELAERALARMDADAYA